jgi:RNA polymerase sigma-70 factor (ECF subfamily)
MPTSESTCWTVIRAAAAGSPADREELARRYLGVVRAYLSARWRGSALRDDLDDATQEVFVECFRAGGALEAAGAGRVPNFRAFLYGVVRNVAPSRAARCVRRTRCRTPRTRRACRDCSSGPGRGRSWPRPSGCNDDRPRSAARRPSGASSCCGCASRRGCPSGRSPSAGADAAKLHHADATARQEFRAALLEVVAFPHPGSPAEVEQEATSLLRALP